jgi:hypothetical protein
MTCLWSHFWKYCGEAAISLHSHHVSLVQWTNPLLPVTRDLGINTLGGLIWNQDSPVGDPDVIDHFCGLVWGGLRPEPSLGPCADNVIIPLDLTQLSVPVSRSLQVLLLASQPRSQLLGGSPVESLQSHFILTMSHCSNGLTLCFASQGIWVQIPWGT